VSSNKNLADIEPIAETFQVTFQLVDAQGPQDFQIYSPALFQRDLRLSHAFGRLGSQYLRLLTYFEDAVRDSIFRSGEFALSFGMKF
jgi:hypothetical protein